MKGWKKTILANGNQEGAGVAMLISDKIGFKSKKVIRVKESNNMIIRQSIQKEYIKVIDKHYHI